MNITSIITRDEQNFVIISAPAGQIALNLGSALAAADGSNEVKSVIRTTKNFAEITNRTITEAEATEALNLVVAKMDAALVEEFNNTFNSQKAAAIEAQIVAALQA